MTSPRASILPAACPAVGAATPPAGASSHQPEVPYSVAAFVDTWIAAPRKATAQPRIDFGPQYNGVGECPF